MTQSKTHRLCQTEDKWSVYTLERKNSIKEFFRIYSEELLIFYKEF